MKLDTIAAHHARLANRSVSRAERPTVGHPIDLNRRVITRICWVAATSIAVVAVIVLKHPSA